MIADDSQMKIKQQRESIFVHLRFIPAICV